MDIGHWNFSHEFDPSDWFGFIYRITELDTGREYIGKKQFTKLRRKTIKNRKNKKHIHSESDWKSYTGSSVELNASIEAKGISNFKFEIESLHKSRGSLHYAEVQTQILENVLRETLEDGTKKFFNKVINGVKFLPPAEHSEETKMKIKHHMLLLFANGQTHWMHKKTPEELEEWFDQNLRGNNRPILRNKTPEEYQNWILENLAGVNNPMYGKKDVKSGKTYEEFYGYDRAIAIKDRLSNFPHLSGENHPMYGKTHSAETRKKLSESHKGKNTGSDNPMYGKPCHYKMSQEEKERWKKNVGDSVRGLKRSDETKARMSAAAKGKKMATATCPHCGKTGGRGNLLRYHFNNCKSIST